MFMAQGAHVHISHICFKSVYIGFVPTCFTWGFLPRCLLKKLSFIGPCSWLSFTGLCSCWSFSHQALVSMSSRCVCVLVSLWLVTIVISSTYFSSFNYVPRSFFFNVSFPSKIISPSLVYLFNNWYSFSCTFWRRNWFTSNVLVFFCSFKSWKIF